MGESARTGQLGAPLRFAPSCCLRGSSPMARHLSGSGPGRALQGLWGAGLASCLAVSAIGNWP
eukprot:3994052-Alexandrium_andersonii.AAC.1